MTHIINEEWDGDSIKEYLRKKLDLSSRMITRLKNDPEGIFLNGNRVTVRGILHKGDVLSLNTEHEPKTSDNIIPSEIPLDIIYEDEYYIAINKQPGLPTHPSHDHYDDTLANGLSYLYEQRKVPFVFRAVNRLDKDTSGTVVFAKSSDAAYRFSALQINKFICKKYLTIVEGSIESDFELQGYIRRKGKSVIEREFLENCESPDCQFSHTSIKLLDSSNGFSLLECILHTGRTHQIRSSLSSIGCPVIYDRLYGSTLIGKRQMLHSRSISFTHPYTEKQTSFISPIPYDFHTELSIRGLKYDTTK